MSAGQLPPPGTVLRKVDRNGTVRCEAVVGDGGQVIYRGVAYSSISAAARVAAIDIGLAARSCDGYAFFGLKNRSDTPRVPRPAAAPRPANAATALPLPLPVRWDDLPSAAAPPVAVAPPATWDDLTTVRASQTLVDHSAPIVPTELVPRTLLTEEIVFATVYDHSKHGRADERGVPIDPDCACRNTTREEACAQAGCGYCRAARMCLSGESIIPGAPPIIPAVPSIVPGVPAAFEQAPAVSAVLEEALKDLRASLREEVAGEASVEVRAPAPAKIGQGPGASCPDCRDDCQSWVVDGKACHYRKAVSGHVMREVKQVDGRNGAPECARCGLVDDDRTSPLAATPCTADIPARSETQRDEDPYREAASQGTHSASTQDGIAEEAEPTPAPPVVRCSRSAAFNAAAPCLNIVVGEFGGTYLCAWHAQQEGYETPAPVQDATVRLESNPPRAVLEFASPVDAALRTLPGSVHAESDAQGGSSYVPLRRCMKCGYGTSIGFSHAVDPCIDGEHDWKDFPDGESAADLEVVKELLSLPMPMAADAAHREAAVSKMRADLLAEIDDLLQGTPFWQGGRLDTIKHLMACVEKAEAEAAVRGGEWCAENRATGRGPCGACAWCCKQATDRAEQAEAALASLQDATRRLVRVNDEMGDAVFFGVPDSNPKMWEELTAKANAVLDACRGLLPQEAESATIATDQGSVPEGSPAAPASNTEGERRQDAGAVGTAETAGFSPLRQPEPTGPAPAPDHSSSDVTKVRGVDTASSEK